MPRRRRPAQGVEGLGVGFEEAVRLLQFGQQRQFCAGRVVIVIVVAGGALEPHCCGGHRRVAAPIGLDHQAAQRRGRPAGTKDVNVM